MCFCETKRMLATSLIVVAMAMAPTSAVQAATIVEPGWDLFETETAFLNFAGTPLAFLGILPFEGAPLGTFDFGSGPVPVGDADTIVERLQAAGNAILDSDTIDIEIVALSLISKNPVDIGNGLENLIVSLVSDLGDSEMTIDGLLHPPANPHGTFDSTLHFTVSLEGTITGLLPGVIEKIFESSGNEWQHEVTGLAIDGVNHLLDGGTENGDFWLIGSAFHDAGDDTTHQVRAPEPGTGLLMGLGLLGMASRRRS